MRLARTKTLPRRPAFTLVEMLVVIAIIAILVALVGSAMFYWIGGQQRRSTEGNVRTVYKVLQEQWAYVVDQAKKETPSDAAKTAANTGNNGNPGADPTGERARVLWTKIRLMEAFPMTFAEINNNASNNDPVFALLAAAIPTNRRKNLDTYQRASKGLKAAANPATESAACLLMALTVSRGGSVLTSDQIAAFVADTDGDGIKEIVDSFRMPMVFYRFAWSASAANPNIQALNPAPANSKGAKLADPLDPGGLLVTWPNTANPARTSFETYFHPIASPQGAYYVIPVIVSAGRDTQLGLALPSYQIATTGLMGTTPDITDNVYSFNLTGN